MASTVPAKSQPLHNFTLPHLRWNKDGHSSGNHRRRSTKSPSRRPNLPSAASPVRRSPLRDSVGATPPRYHSPMPDAAASPRESPVNGNYLGKQSVTGEESSKHSKPELFREGAKHSLSPARGGDSARHLLPSRDFVSEPEDLVRIKGGGFIEHRRNNSRNPALDSARNGIYATNSERVVQKSETKSRTKDVDGAGIRRSKILIKIPCKTNKTEEENPQEEPLKIDEYGEAEAQEEGKTNNFDEEAKTWNLRPRKPIRKSMNMNGVTVKNIGLSVPEKHKTQSPSRNLPKTEGKCCGGGGGEKKEKRKLSISVALLKEEIEEDIFALTGSKPARRPKKRTKSIQKQVDSVLPGMWLVGITADSYKVYENSLKG